MSDLGSFFSNLFDTGGFPPRWFCGSAWTTDLGSAHIISDVTIFLAYLSIPVSIFIFSKKQESHLQKVVFLLFMAFISLCGISHLIEASLFWYPWYRLSALVKVLTALASVATALVLAFNLRRLLSIPADLRAKKYLEHVIDTIPHAIMIVNEEGIIKLCNKEICLYTGYSPKDLIDKPCSLLFSGIPETRIKDSIREAVNTRHGLLKIFKLTKNSGVTKEIEASLSLVNYQNEEQILFSLVDLGQRNEIEHTTKKLHAILNNAIDGIITIDERGSILTFNPAAERTFGYKETEVMGRNLKMLMPEPYHTEHDGYLRNYIKTGVPKVIGIGREVTAMRRDGGIFPMELGVSAFSVNEQQMFVGIVRDISERKKSEEVLQKYAKKMERANRDLQLAKKEADKANSLKSEFLSSMSHELRTPMHAILSYTSLGLKSLPEKGSDTLLKYFTNIKVSGDRLLVLLNNLLDLAKLEAGKMEFNIEENNFHDVIDSTIIEIEPLLLKKGLKHEIKFKSKGGIAAFDREKIVQVLVNLMSNAIKFSPDNSTITISVEESVLKSKKEKGILCSVEDEGVGIPENELEFVFKKFNQSSQTKTQAGGTGLGLSICREIVEAHGGSIWAKNGQKSGAIFQFLIPLQAPKMDA